MVMNNLVKTLLSINEELLEDEFIVNSIKENIIREVPELKELFELKTEVYMKNQTLGENILRGIVFLERDILLRIAMLFGDIGLIFLKGKDFGNKNIEERESLEDIAEVSITETARILGDLGFNEENIDYINLLIKNRFKKELTEKYLESIYKVYGKKAIRDIIRINEVDILRMEDKYTLLKRKNLNFYKYELIKINKQNNKLRLKDLDIDKNDLELIGISDKDKDIVLENLLGIIKCDEEINCKPILLGLIKNM